MALTLAENPEMVGLKAFLDKCDCNKDNFDVTNKCYRVTVAGVTLRITEDKEYVVEQDLNPGRKMLPMDKKKLITAAAYRVRAAYSTTRVESQVGSKRLTVYRQLRKDDKASIFFARSRAQGGKTPPPVMALSIMRYYVHDIGAEELGLNKFPEFLTLLENIELLPGCNLEETLRGKHQRRQRGEEEDKAAASDEEEDVASEEVVDIDVLKEELKKLKSQNSNLKMKLKSHLGGGSSLNNNKYHQIKSLMKIVRLIQSEQEEMKAQIAALAPPPPSSPVAVAETTATSTV